MLVGNKADLSGKYRRVTYEQASVFSHQNRISFMEVSARKNMSIDEAFDNLIKIYINSGLLKRQPLNILSKFDDKHSNNNSGSKMKKPSIITTMTKKEGRDCIIM